MLYADLSNLFFEEVFYKFEKYFAKEWCRTELMQLTITFVPKVLSSFAKKLLNIYILNESFTIKLAKVKYTYYYTQILLYGTYY